MMVLSPKGSSGLNAPMRRERPAARRIAATSLGFGRWSLVFGLGLSKCCCIRITSQGQKPRPKTEDRRPKTLPGRGQFLECAQRVLPRHLLAPLVNKVCIVERAGFDVGSLGGG